MGITGNYWMKFIGRPNGKLMKHAPGNFIHGKKYKVPYGHSKWPFWELLEKPPVLKVEKETESFEEAYYIPEEELTVTESTPLEEITITPSVGDDENYNFDPNAPARIEPYLKFNPDTGETSAVDPTEYLQPESEVTESDVLKMEIARLQKALEEAQKSTEPDVEPKEKLDRKELLKTLAEAGIEVKPRTRTTTLKKMVDGLDEN